MKGFGLSQTAKMWHRRPVPAGLASLQTRRRCCRGTAHRPRHLDAPDVTTTISFFLFIGLLGHNPPLYHRSLASNLIFLCTGHVSMHAATCKHTRRTWPPTDIATPQCPSGPNQSCNLLPKLCSSFCIRKKLMGGSSRTSLSHVNPGLQG